MGGLRHLTGEPGRVPVRVGVSIGDTLAALHGTIGVLMALYHRKAHGGAGQVIDVALHEAGLQRDGKPDPRIQRIRRGARSGGQCAARASRLRTPTGAATATCWSRATATASSGG
jgi:formyl-CoA transferase